MWVTLTRREEQGATTSSAVPRGPEVLTVAGLRVVDETGNVRVSIDADPGGDCRISLWGLLDDSHATIRIDEAGNSFLMLGGAEDGGRVSLNASPGPDGSSSLLLNSGSPISGVFAGATKSGSVLNVKARNSRSKFEVRQDGRDLRADLIGQDDSLLWSTHADPD
jgi:hypothetical protein